jgi:hypothetical protein
MVASSDTNRCSHSWPLTARTQQRDRNGGRQREETHEGKGALGGLAAEAERLVGKDEHGEDDPDSGEEELQLSPLTATGTPSSNDDCGEGAERREGEERQRDQFERVGHASGSRDPHWIRPRGGHVLVDRSWCTHVMHILAKLELRDRVQAVVLAYETGLVRPGDDKP